MEYKKINIEISNKIRNFCPDFVGAAVFASVSNSPHNIDLWENITNYTNNYKATHQLEDIKNNKAIQATREAYKKLGKDPNRYRPSAEALCRRIVRGLPLYQINTLVDLINLISIHTGYSIGGFDSEKIAGNKLVLDIGMANEPFEAIGRGFLNIEGLPVYRDDIGGIGTPTSDNERTKLNLETKQFLAIINGYSGKDGLENAVKSMHDLLIKYTEANIKDIFYF